MSATCGTLGLAGLIVALPAGTALDRPDAATVRPSVPPTDRNLPHAGRWDRIDPANFHGNWIGSYVRTSFTGTSVGAVLGGRSALVVVIDGEPARVVAGGPGAVRLNAAPLARETHTLLVGCKGGGGWDFQGLVLDAGAATRPPTPRPIIEFVGDSITCGSPDPIEATGNYAWLTAEALGSDHAQIAWPGRSLMTGYGFQDDKVGLDIQYFQQNCFYDSPKVSWVFSTYTPEMVVINLGQNDGAEGQQEGAFLSACIDFITNMRGKYPSARIVAMRPFSGRHDASIRKAVETVKEYGDGGVHCIDTTGWLLPGDFADGVHPSTSGNVKAAKRLAAELKALEKLPTANVAVPAKYRATIGDPRRPGELPSELHAACEKGARYITVRPGVYRIPRTGSHVFFLKEWVVRR